MDGMDVIPAGGTAVADAGATPDTGAIGGADGGAAPEPEGGAAPPAAPDGAAPDGTEDQPAPDGGETDKAPETEEDDSEFDASDGSAAEEKVKRAISELKKTHPEQAKQWQKDHYHLKGFEAEFATVQEARSAKATIESLGGEEGINALQDEVGDYRKEIEQFANGDAALIEELYKANPEGIVAAARNAMGVLAAQNKALFDEALSGPMFDRLESVGLYKHLGDLSKLIQEGKGQEAFDLLGNIQRWFGSLKDLANKSREGATKRDPQAEALNERERLIKQGEENLRITAITTDVNRRNNSSIQKTVDGFFKELKLPEGGRKRFVQQLQDSVYAAMKADKTYLRQVANIRAKGDNKRTAEFIAGKFAELLPEHFRTVRNELYPNYRPAVGKRPATAGAPAKPGTPAAAGGASRPAAASGSVLTATPPRDQVDWSKTTDLNWIQGKNIFLKGGKGPYSIDWKAVKA